MTPPLRFAPLIRVSSEAQAKKGESLNTQKKQIIGFVKQLGGKIPDNCWQYSGQEHATPGQERKKLDKLLRDAEKQKFDAVIVCDASRWSRDNVKSKKGLEILRSNGVRFFVGTTEYNLDMPQDRLFLGMATEMNEYFAMEQVRKSMLNRIERAKSNIPPVSRLPYARTFDRKTNKWGIDKNKAAKVKWAAEQYLKGVSTKTLCKAMGMYRVELWKLLKTRCGDRWEIKFNSDRLNIHETVELKVPRLLPEKTIKKILKRAQSNKTFTHPHLKNKYLLSRMIFCDECGYAMHGATFNGPKKRYQYYRHVDLSDRKRPCCTRKFSLRLEKIEEAVLLRLFKMYGDVANLEKAMKRAIPDADRIAGLREQKKALTADLKSAEKERGRIVNAIAKGIIDEDDAKNQMEDLKARHKILTDQLSSIDSELKNIPTDELIEQNAQLMKRILRDVHHLPSRLNKMSWEDKRKIVEMAFGGTDSLGHRCGVYVRNLGDENETVEYMINGIIPDISYSGKLPMDRDELIDLLRIDDRYQDVDEELKKYKLSCFVGGFVGMRIALRRPDLLKSLVLMDTSADADGKKASKRNNLLLWIVKYVGYWAVIGQVLPMMFHNSFLKDSSRQSEVKHWRNIVTGHSKKGIVPFGKGIFSRNSVLEQLADLALPVAVIVGEQDIATTPNHAQRMVNIIPNAKLYKIPDAGHSAAVEKPTEVADAMRDFYTSAGII